MNECYVDGCTNNADRVWSEDRSKRLCEKHFKRWENTGKFSLNRDESWGMEVNRKYKEKECVYCKQTKKIAAKGLCRACYQRQQKTGSLEYKRKGKVNYCKVEGCDKKIISNGLCDPHRKMMARRSSTESSRPSDWGLRQKHPLYTYWNDVKRRSILNISNEWSDDFWDFVNCVKERPSKNHFIRALDVNKPLGKNNWQWVEGLTESMRKQINSKKGKEYNKKRLKLSIDERKAIYEKYGNSCMICGKNQNNNDCPVTGEVKTSSLCIDHCHKAGEVRGLLCRACNSGLGHFKDNPDLLVNAIKYLTPS
jgi:hypothetical protein